MLGKMGITYEAEVDSMFRMKIEMMGWYQLSLSNVFAHQSEVKIIISETDKAIISKTEQNDSSKHSRTTHLFSRIISRDYSYTAAKSCKK